MPIECKGGVSGYTVSYTIKIQSTFLVFCLISPGPSMLWCYGHVHENDQQSLLIPKIIISQQVTVTWQSQPNCILVDGVPESTVHLIYHFCIIWDSKGHPSDGASRDSEDHTVIVGIESHSIVTLWRSQIWSWSWAWAGYKIDWCN